MKNKNSIKAVALKLKITETEVRRLEKTAIKKILKTDIGKALRDYLEKH